MQSNGGILTSSNRVYNSYGLASPYCVLWLGSPIEGNSQTSPDPLIRCLWVDCNELMTFFSSLLIDTPQASLVGCLGRRNFGILYCIHAGIYLHGKVSSWGTVQVRAIDGNRCVFSRCQQIQAVSRSIRYEDDNSDSGSNESSNQFKDDHPEFQLKSNPSSNNKRPSVRRLLSTSSAATTITEDSEINIWTSIFIIFIDETFLHIIEHFILVFVTDHPNFPFSIMIVISNISLAALLRVAFYRGPIVTLLPIDYQLQVTWNAQQLMLFYQVCWFLKILLKY